MTEDLILGNAQVEVMPAPREYFASREVTVNQLYCLDDEICGTPLALVDTLAGNIRVTQSHLNYNRGRVHPIVAFKVLRFAAAMEAEGRQPTVLPMRIGFRRRSHPFSFFLALQLSRAFESGRGVAESYLGYCRQWQLLEKAELPEDVTAVDAAGILKQRLAEYDLHFPGAGLDD